MEYIKTVEDYTKTNIQTALQNPYFMAILKISLILYASQLAPRLPEHATSYFQNPFVKIISIFFIGLIADVDFQLAIILAVIFVVGSNLMSGRGLLESYSDTAMSFSASQNEFMDLLGKPTTLNKLTILESKTDNFPGCNGITIKDLLEVFDNDALKLQKGLSYTYHQLVQTMPPGEAKENLLKMARYTGLPYNVPLTDENAPLISTLLLQVGYSISKTCTAPQQ